MLDEDRFSPIRHEANNSNSRARDCSSAHASVRVGWEGLMLVRRTCLVVTWHVFAWQEQLDGELPSTIDGRRLEDRSCKRSGLQDCRQNTTSNS